MQYFIVAALFYFSLAMVSIPVLLGLPLNVWLGFLLFIQVVFQVLTGKRILKVNLKYHRINGVLILLVALLHALIGLGLRFLGWTVG